MAWGKSTKQRKAARRRSWTQHIRGLEGFEEKRLAALTIPPEMIKLTKREREWAKQIADAPVKE
jgi:hypothetical protein